MAEYPGDIVDSIGGGAAGAVKGIVNSIGGGLRSAGGQLQNAVDIPFRALGLPGSPLKVIDPPLRGVVGAIENAINNGVIGSAEMVGRGVTSGLDEIPKALSGVSGSKLPAFPRLR